jgi:hypothetical protein
MTREEDMRQERGPADLDAGAEAEARRLLAAAFETAPVRPGLAAGLAASPGPRQTASPAGDVVGLVRGRAARARRRRVLVPAGALALAAAVAGGITAGVLTDRGQEAPTALQAITAALVKTSSQSFTFTDTAAGRNGSRPLSAGPTETGAFDPVTRTGWVMDYPAGGGYQRTLWVGGFRYVYLSPQLASPSEYPDGKPWTKYTQPPPLSANSPGLIISITSSFFNPNEMDGPTYLLALLRSATAVREDGPASGPGWTGTGYDFTTKVTVASGARESIDGTVSVDASGRIRRLHLVIQSHDPGSKAAVTPNGLKVPAVPPSTGEAISTLTFGGFGTPVSVTPPPASEVYSRQS